LRLLELSETESLQEKAFCAMSLFKDEYMMGNFKIEEEVLSIALHVW
jgi:hypothetical protein